MRTVPLTRADCDAAFEKSSTFASAEPCGAFGYARTIEPLFVGSGSSVSIVTGPYVTPPSVEYATLRYFEPAESRELSMTRPSDSSTVLFSSMPVPTGVPTCHVAPWSSEYTDTACTAPAALMIVYCWRRRPAYWPYLSGMPWPEDAKRERAPRSPVTSAVIVRCVHERPSSVELETFAWMTLRAVGSVPGCDPQKPWS